MVEMMNALAITEVGNTPKVELMRLPKPKADQDNVVIRTAYSGVSVGTEMWIAAGRRSDYGAPPFVNGYEATGEIVEVGADLQHRFKPGELVAVFCNGAHSEYVKSSSDRIHKLHSPESLKAASMFVQPSVAANAWNMASVNTGDTIYVVGQGLVGQCAAYLAKLRGAYVIASDISKERIDISRKHCADWVIDSSEVRVVDEILQRFPKGVDLAMESTGFQKLIEDGVQATKYNGRFVFLGWYPENVTFNSGLLQNRQLTSFYPVFIGPHSVQAGVIRLIESGKLQLNDLISHEVGWESSAEIYSKLFGNGRNEFNGIVFKW